MTLADSLRHVIAYKDSLLGVAATRTVHISPPAPSVTVNVPPELWWNTPIVGGAIAFAAGMITPLVIDRVQRKARRRRLVQVLAAELGILQFRMIAACLSAARRMNRLNAATLAVLRSRITPRLETGDLKKLRGMIDRIAQLSPTQLAAWQAQPPGRERAFTLRRYDLAYLESSLPELHLLRPDAQSLLLQLRGSLRLFNEHVDDAVRYHWLTFETLQDQNRDAIEQNIPTTRGHALNMALLVVGTISTVLDQPDFARTKPSQAQVDPQPADLDPTPASTA